MKRFLRHGHWVLLSVAAAVFFAAAAGRVSRASNDFVPVYTGVRCLLSGANPYDTAQLERAFYQAGGHRGELPSWDIDVPVYPPSTFVALAPLGWLNFPQARLLWFLVNGCLFVTAAVLIAQTSGNGAVSAGPWAASVLVSAVLATSSILLILGQPATLAISLLLIGTCLLLRGRWFPLATLALVLSLAVKPQIGGLAVVYLLVQRVSARKTALHAAAALAGSLALLLGGIGLLQAHPGSRAWASTLSANLASTLGPAGSADPRPQNQQAVGDINLQAVSSVFLANAQAFNRAAYAVFLLLLVLWVMAFMRASMRSPISSHGSPDAYTDRHWMALAGVAILTLLPVYHRFYDSRLLLLTVPATILIWQRSRWWGAAAGGLTLLSTISVQYRVQQWLLAGAAWPRVAGNKLLFVLLLRQQNLELLLLFGLFLLWTRKVAQSNTATLTAELVGA